MSKQTDPLRSLSPRLQICAFWISQGLPAKDISRKMRSSQSATKMYLWAIDNAVGSSNQIERMNAVRGLVFA